ncbi:ABC transporter ATP-binding protein [Streptomyces avermitilis]|uniref:ABC transporter ATP-binding protein n=2 Tax=Streptomyces TaxID=1883 RepID=Q82AF2_STRAW|nr:ABC transporter ATP-binding protein [Streptomyces avermitilis]OOV28177.1 ABC transporter ATP-binding protein [Streptomyces avermitilis]BAC73817.1 putative ABC transporter ATP-binding protein [Streptomyces avermitilis MA-4680 = NBRC 14893]
MADQRGHGGYVAGDVTGDVEGGVEGDMRENRPADTQRDTQADADADARTDTQADTQADTQGGLDGPRAPVGIAVGAENFGLKGPRGWAFRGVGFDAAPGSLIAVEGPSGSGRTCLLLALTGRMKPTEGHATVGSLRLPKQMSAVRLISAPAHVPGVTDLDPALTVGEHLGERALLERRYGGSLRGLLRPRAERTTEAKLRIDTALAAAGLDREALPKGSRTAVRDLERLQALRLSIALALIGRPRLLAVDDTDLKLSDAERAEVWTLLTSLTESGTTVVAVCSEAPAGAVVVSTRQAAEPTHGTPDAHETHETHAASKTPETLETNDKETADALPEAGRA